MMRSPSSRRGFSLIEILIVVLLLAILASIVIPQFTLAGDDARESQLATNLARVRKQIALYIMEHKGKGPHLDENGALARHDIVRRLTERTDPDGTLNADGECGPYINAWPANPFMREAFARRVLVGKQPAPPRNGRSGWYYCTETCILSANSTTGGESTDPAPQSPPQMPQPPQRAQPPARPQPPRPISP